MTFSALLKQSTFEDLSSFLVGQFNSGRGKKDNIYPHCSTGVVPGMNLDQQLYWPKHNRRNCWMLSLCSEQATQQTAVLMNRLQWKILSIVHSRTVNGFRPILKRKSALSLQRNCHAIKSALCPFRDSRFDLLCWGGRKQSETLSCFISHFPGSQKIVMFLPFFLETARRLALN